MMHPSFRYHWLYPNLEAFESVPLTRDIRVINLQNELAYGRRGETPDPV